MTYSMDNEYGPVPVSGYEALYHSAVDAVLDDLACPYEACVDLLLTDDARIRVINKDTRGIDVATDVLSFPMSEYEEPGAFQNLEEQSDAFDPDSGELMLGDIVLSLDHVVSNAREYGHSNEREYAFLIVHSMLHLTGFDHIEEADRIRMDEAQERIMGRLGITR